MKEREKDKKKDYKGELQLTQKDRFKTSYLSIQISINLSI